MTQLPFGLGVHLRPAGGRDEPEYLAVLLGKPPTLREGLTHLRAKGLQRRGQPVHPVLGGTGLVTLEELGVGRSQEWVRRGSSQGSEALTVGSPALLGGQIQQERPSQPVVQ